MSPPSSLLRLSSREPLSSHGDDGLAYKILLGPNGGLRVEVVGDGDGGGGGATAANQTTEIAKLTSIDNKFPAVAAPTDADPNSSLTSVVARLQIWDPTANGGTGGWIRLLSNSVGQPVVQAAIVDANTGNAFDYLSPLQVEDCAQRMTAVALAGDTTFTAPLPKMVYVGTAGVLKIDCTNRAGVPATGLSVTVGQGFFRLRGITKIYSTANGTTASGVFACD